MLDLTSPLPSRPQMQRALRLLSLLLPIGLVACSSAPPLKTASQSPPVARTTSGKPLPALPAAGSGRGGYYKDDGPGDQPPDGLLDIPDAEPKVEPYSKAASRPYVVFGKTYTPMLEDKPFKQRGIGSWYGKKFHGQKTSSGELYDMYKMTAAHPTLPIPSYARVTNLKPAPVIVRINDRAHSIRRALSICLIPLREVGILVVRQQRAGSRTFVARGNQPAGGQPQTGHHDAGEQSGICAANCAVSARCSRAGSRDAGFGHAADT